MGVAAKTASSDVGRLSMVAMTSAVQLTTCWFNGSKDVMTTRQCRSGNAAYDAPMMQSTCTA